MADKIARLKISADVSEYLAAARQKVEADEKMVRSGDQAAQAVERTDKLHGRAAGGIERLRREAEGLSYVYATKLERAERLWADAVAKQPGLAAEAEKNLATLREKYNKKIEDEARAHDKAAISVGAHATNMRNLRFAMGDFVNSAVFSRGDPIMIASNLVDTIPQLLEMRAQYAAAGMSLSGVASAALAAGGAVAGLAAVWGTMAYAADQRTVAVRNLENQLRAVGMADRSLVEQAQTAVGRTGGEIGAYGTTLSAAGKFVGNPYLSAGTASRLVGLVDDYARLTGGSTTDAAGQLASMFDGSVASVDALQRQFRLLDEAALQTARQMAKSGDAAGAYDLMIGKIEERLRNSAGAWDQFGNWIDRIWTGFQRFSSADPGSLEEQLARARRNQSWFGGRGNDEQVAELERRIRERDASAADARRRAAEFDAKEEVRQAQERLSRSRQLEGMTPRERQAQEAQWSAEDAARLAGARPGLGSTARDMLLSQQRIQTGDNLRQLEQQAAQAEARARAVSQGPAALRLFEDQLRARQSLGLAWGEQPVAMTTPGVTRVSVAASDRWSTIINAAARETGLDANLIRAVIQQESGGNPLARSKAGAVGLMQLMPGTAADLGVTDRTNPIDNVMGGSRYLADMVGQFGVEGGLAAYNMGPGAYRKFLAGKRGMSAETQAYSSAVLGRMDAPAATYQDGQPRDVLGEATANATRQRIAEQSAALEEWSRRTEQQIGQTDRLTRALEGQGGTLRDAQIANEALSQAVSMGIDITEQATDADRAQVRAIEDKIRVQKQSGDAYQSAQARAYGNLQIQQRERALFAGGGDRAALDARSQLEERWQYTGRPADAEARIANEESNARQLYQMDRMEALWNSVGDSAANAFEQMVLGGGNFRNVLGQLLQDIARLGLREIMSGSDSALSGIFGSIGKGIAGAFAGGVGGTTGYAEGSAFSGVALSLHDGTFPDWPRYHNGKIQGTTSGQAMRRGSSVSSLDMVRGRDYLGAGTDAGDVRGNVIEVPTWPKYHDGKVQGQSLAARSGRAATNITSSEVPAQDHGEDKILSRAQVMALPKFPAGTDPAAADLGRAAVDGDQPQDWPRYHNGKALLQAGEVRLRNGTASLIMPTSSPVPGIARDEVPSTVLPSDIILSRKQVAEMTGWKKFHDGTAGVAAGDSVSYGAPSISISVDARGAEAGVEEKVRQAAHEAAVNALAMAYPAMVRQASKASPGVVRDRVQRTGRL